jgi:hypothetical protein
MLSITLRATLTGVEHFTNDCYYRELQVPKINEACDFPGYAGNY